MKLTQSRLKEMIKHSIDELAIQQTLKLSNDLEVEVMDDGSAVMKTRRGVVNLSPKNYKILRQSIKRGKLESVNEAKREIGGYYLMKQLKDLAQDAKRGGERKVHKALMYLHDRINQSYRDIDLNPRDVQDIFNDPRGRKYSKDMPDWMIDSLFEGKMNEAKKKVPVEKLSVGNTYKDSRGYPVKIVDISTGGDMRGGGSSWKITYKDSHGKKKIIKTSLRKGINLYESINESNKLLKQSKLSSTEYQRAKKLSGFKAANYKWDSKQDLYIKEGKINEAGMFDDYHKLNRAYMDDFIKNYKKLNRRNVVKKKGDDIYGFRKGEREAHWKYDDNFKLHYDIEKVKVLGLINFFNRAKKDHPWS